MAEPRKPLVIVVWLDAWVSEEGCSDDMAASLHKPEEVTTIGWVLVDNAAGLQISNEFYGTTYRGRTFIPRAMVKSVTPYKLSKPSKPRKKANTPPPEALGP